MYTFNDLSNTAVFIMHEHVSMNTFDRSSRLHSIDRCSALQCVAVRCSVLQCVAVCCSALQCVAACCSVLQRVAESCILNPQP